VAIGRTSRGVSVPTRPKAPILSNLRAPGNWKRPDLNIGTRRYAPHLVLSSIFPQPPHRPRNIEQIVPDYFQRVPFGQTRLKLAQSILGQSVGILKPIVPPCPSSITAEVCPGSPNRYLAAKWEPPWRAALALDATAACAVARYLPIAVRVTVSIA
jgi:hypothetical protein